MVKEIVVHEVPVALVVLVRQTEVLIHIKGDDVGEGDLPGLVHAHQLPVHADRGGSCRKAEHEGALILVAVDLRRNIVRRPFTHIFIVFLNNNPHNLAFLI